MTITNQLVYIYESSSILHIINDRSLLSNFKKYKIKYGTVINTANKSGYTTIKKCYINNQINTMKHLIDQGADISYINIC